MPPKPRDQWIPNEKLKAARERMYGRKSRTRFANAVKRRCEVRFGGHCGVDHRKVRHWEEGACAPDPCHQEAICDLFEVAWEERQRLGFGEPVGNGASCNEYAVETDGVFHPGFAVATGQVPDGIADAARGAVPSEPLQLDEPWMTEHPALIASGSTGWTLELNGTSRLDPELLSDLEALVDIYRRIDRKLGAPVIVGELSRHLERLPVLKNLSAPLSLRTRLAAHAADVATLVAWQCLDMGRIEQAWGYYQSARTAAQEAGNSELHAFVVAEMSYVPLLTGSVRQAALLVDHAERLSHGSVSPTSRAWLAGVRAEGCSLRQDEVQCLRMMERGAVILESAVPGESPLPPFSYFDASHLIRWQGQCLAQLGRGTEAHPILEQALGTVAPSFVRARAGMSLDLAYAYLQQDGLEPACEMAGQGLVLARATQSVRYQQRVIMFRAQLEPWANDPAVQRLDAALWRPLEGRGG